MLSKIYKYVNKAKVLVIKNIAESNLRFQKAFHLIWITSLCLEITQSTGLALPAPEILSL